jgi:hypothetical protein
MSVINLSSPTAVAERILPANSSQTQCLQGFNPLVDLQVFGYCQQPVPEGEIQYTTTFNIRQAVFENNSK